MRSVILAAVCATAGLIALGAVQAGNPIPATQPATQPAEVAGDPVTFARLVPPGPTGVKVEKIATGFRFLEGPSWWPAKGGLVFSDIPADTQFLYVPGNPGTPEPAIKPSRNANGTTIDPEGRLVICRHGARDVVRMEKDGTVTVLAERFEGKRFNSPNDAVVGNDGVVWFTDPPCGVKKEDREMTECNVYRIGRDGSISLAVKDLKGPNGIALSPDGKTLYVTESAGTVKPKFINAYDVKTDGALGDGRNFWVVEKGTPDGIRVDAEGNLWTTTGEGVEIVSNEGKLIGKITVPEVPANLEFSSDGKRLYVTARTSLYAVDVAVKRLR